MQQSEWASADETNKLRWKKKCSDQRGYTDKRDAVVRTWHGYGNVLIQRQSAHSAVVLPGTFPLAHFGVVALKRVAMRQVARKIHPELRV